MFCGCKSLAKLDVRGLKAENVTNVSYMFSSCEKVKYLDLSFHGGYAYNYVVAKNCLLAASLSIGLGYKYSYGNLILLHLNPYIGIINEI